MFSRNFIFLFSEHLAPGRPTDSAHPDARVGCCVHPAQCAPPVSIPHQRPASGRSTAACIVPCARPMSHLAAAPLNSTSRTSSNYCGEIERREGKEGEGEERAKCFTRGRSRSLATSRCLPTTGAIATCVNTSDLFLKHRDATITTYV